LPTLKAGGIARRVATRPSQVMLLAGTGVRMTGGGLGNLANTWTHAAYVRIGVWLSTLV